MKLLLNQGLPRSAAFLLIARGHDSVHVGELGMAEAKDADIIREAERQNRVVVTLDADYHRILATSGAVRPSVIRMRIEGLKAAPLSALLCDVISQCENDLIAGAMVSVESDRLRVRRLPVH